MARMPAVIVFPYATGRESAAAFLLYDTHLRGGANRRNGADKPAICEKASGKSSGAEDAENDNGEGYRFSRRPGCDHKLAPWANKSESTGALAGAADYRFMRLSGFD